MRNFIVLCLLACLASCTDKKEFQTIRERIDLSGNWNSSLGNCTLPGTTDENKLGDGRHPTNVTSQLTRTYPYSGIVEYEKDVEIPVQMEGKRLILFMERTKPSTLWIDGDSIGTLGHIYAPHCYSLPALAPGSHHIKIRIDNSPQLRTSRNPKLACLDRRHTNQLERHSGRLLHRSGPTHLSQAGTSLPICKGEKGPHPCKHIQRFGAIGRSDPFCQDVEHPTRTPVTGHGKTSRLEQR